MRDMGKLHARGNWFLKVLGNEHPPVHVHVIHPDGKAQVFLDGRVVVGKRVPDAVIGHAVAWVAAHQAEIRAEWERMDNPQDRGQEP